MKKKAVIIFSVILIAIAGLILAVFAISNQRTVLSNLSYDEGEWRLVWSDEFDGDKLNQDIWVNDVGKDKWGNEELEYYTDGKNLEVKDGNLIITARKEDYEEAHYTSARIKTLKKLEVKYGRIEAKIKLPSGQGIWPAFWMMGVNDGWPRCGEIDIMEAINNCDVLFGTLHWGAEEFEGSQNYIHQSEGTHTGIENATDWHIYAIEWNESGIKWYCDDNCYFEYEFDMNKDGQQAFLNPFYMLLNVAVGGNWTDAPDDSIFPQSMYVDYVRVYSK